MIWSIPFVDHAAARAGLARVPRIDRYQRNTGALRFVGDEDAELMERPRVQARSLTAPGRNPRADALQLFQGNAAFGAFGSLYDHLRDAVIGVFAKPGLLAGKFAKTTFSRLSTSFLKPAPTPRELGTNLLDRVPGISCAIAIDSDVDDAKIYTENLGNFDQVWLVDVTHNGKIELAPHEHQINLTFAKGHQLALVMSADKRNHHAAFNGPDRSGVTLGKADDPIVVGLSSVLAEMKLRLFVQLVGIGHFGDAPDRGLSRETELGSNIDISQLVQGVLPERLAVPRDSSEPVASCVAPLQRPSQSVELISIRCQLQVSYQFHFVKNRIKPLRNQVEMA